MNIISARRGIKALDEKISTLEGNREKAKYKDAWDKNNSEKLGVAKAQARALRAKLIKALEKQGQFSHAPLANGGDTDDG